MAPNSLNLVVNAIETNDSLKSIVTKGPVIINGAGGTKEKWLGRQNFEVKGLGKKLMYNFHSMFR